MKLSSRFSFITLRSCSKISNCISQIPGTRFSETSKEIKRFTTRQRNRVCQDIFLKSEVQSTIQHLWFLLSKSRPWNVRTQDDTTTGQGGRVFCKATEQHRVTAHFPEHRKSVSSNMGLYLVFSLAILSFSHERIKTSHRKSQLPT